jgi:dihydrofolate reductase
MEIVVAMTNNNVIGQNGDMPWNLPADLEHFKKLTLQHSIVMGRRTWESIGRPLPSRINIVMTRQVNYQAEGACVVHSLKEAKAAAGDRRVFIIGGGEIYRKTLPLSSCLHITRINTSLVGDTSFPIIDESVWRCENSVNRPADDKNQYELNFETWTMVN